MQPCITGAADRLLTGNARMSDFENDIWTVSRSELHLLFEPLPSFWIKPLEQESPSRFDKAPQIGNVTLIQGTTPRFRSSLPIEGDFSKRDQNRISVSGLICRVDSVHRVCSDRIYFQITFQLIIFNNSTVLELIMSERKKYKRPQE